MYFIRLCFIYMIWFCTLQHLRFHLSFPSTLFLSLYLLFKYLFINHHGYYIFCFFILLATLYSLFDFQFFLFTTSLHFIPYFFFFFQAKAAYRDLPGVRRWPLPIPPTFGLTSKGGNKEETA